MNHDLAAELSYRRNRLGMDAPYDPAREGRIAAGWKGGTPAEQGAIAARNEGRRGKDMATDPPVSEQQRKAMYAAAEGHSNLGIPKKVGEEFVGKDDFPGYMPYRPISEKDIAAKRALLVNAVPNSPDANRIKDEIEELEAKMAAQGAGRMGGRANDRRIKR